MCCSHVEFGNEICIEFWMYDVVLICAKIACEMVGALHRTFTTSFFI